MSRRRNLKVQLEVRCASPMLARTPALLGAARIACLLALAARCAEPSDGAVALDAGPTPAPVPDPVPAVGFCGDGTVDPGEECDDGSACRDGRTCTDDWFRCGGTSRAGCEPRPGDGCSERCTREPRVACAYGGDCPDATPPSSEDAPDIPLDDGAAAVDAGPVAPAADASVCTPGGFGPPEPVDTGSLEAWAPSLSPDGRTLLFAGAQPFEPERIFVATRGAAERSPFGRATALEGVDSGSGDGSPLLSTDELTLYFYSNRPGGLGGRDLWRATRSDTRSAFGDATALTTLATAGVDHLPWLSADELTLLYVSTRAGGLGQSDIWVATRPALGAEFGDVRPLDGVNTSFDEGRALLTRDGLTVFFASARELGVGQHDLWMATRSDPAAAFGEPSNLSALNSASLDLDPFLSVDERELYFASNRRGRAEIWRARWLCRD
jgi:hypothetical protein